MFDKFEVPGKNPYVATQSSQVFAEAFEELARLFNLKKLVAVPNDQLRRIVLEREVIATHGFQMSLTGVMLCIQPYPSLEPDITCKITIGYILPNLPVQYVTVDGIYANSIWKLRYKE